MDGKHREINPSGEGASGSRSQDWTWFLRPSRGSEGARLSTEERSEILYQVFKMSWEKGKGKDTIERAEICERDIKDFLRYTGYKISANEMNKLKGKMLDKVFEESWEKGKDTIERAEICERDIKDFLRYTGYEIDDNEMNKLKGKILDKVFEESWEKGKGKDIIEHASMCMDETMFVLHYIKHLYDIDREIINIKGKILDKVFEESWEKRKRKRYYRTCKNVQKSCHRC